jgi:predicted exporter
MNRANRAAIVIWLAGLAACLLVVWRSHYTADMSAFLPQRPTASQQLLVEQLKEGNLSRLLVIGIEGADAAARADLSKALAARLVSGGKFAAVQNGDAATSARDRELLFSYRYLLSPTVDAERFSVAGLRRAIAESIDVLTSPAGLLVKNLLPRDPTGEMMGLLGAFDTGKGPASDLGIWVSRDGRRALLMAQTAAAGSDIDAQQQALDRLRADFAAIAPDHTDARLLVAGAPMFALESRATIRGEVERLAVISAIGIILVLLLVYRSVTAIVLGLLPVLSGALAGVAAVSLGFGSVHGLTIGFGTTLIGEAVDYSIYYFVQSRDGADEDWRARFWPTVRLGVLTSLCGFASLLFSGFPGLAQLGLYSMSGLIVAAAVTRFVLPQLRPTGFRIRDTAAIGRAFGPLLERLARLRWIALALAIAALAVLGANRAQLWNTRLSDLSPVSPALLKLDQSLRGDLGAPSQGYLVVIGAPEREAALAAAKRVAGRLQALVDRGVLGGFETPTRLLPDAATQKARQAALPERAELARRLRDAMVGMPLRAERLTPFLDDVQAARQLPPLSVETLKGSTLGLAVDSMLLRRTTGWSVLLPLHPPANGDIDAGALQMALAGEADAVFLDLGAESSRLYADYLREAIGLSLAGFAAIALLLGATLRSATRLARVLAPLVLAVLIVMAGLALTGERLTLLHLVGLLLTVAVGSNYALFFDQGDTIGEPRTLTSLIVANTTTVIGFGALATSAVPVLHAIGVTVGPGAVLALILSAMLTRRQRSS